MVIGLPMPYNSVLMDYLSICAIVKDENSYLPEWIEYHKLVGVERFVILDNGSRIPISETLAKDVAAGTVIVVPFPGHGVQGHAYLHGAHLRRKDTVWMAFIDVDEFICPNEGDDVRRILRDYEGYGGLAVNWQMFGPSGHQRRPSGLQIEAFTMKAPMHFAWNEHVKTFAKPSVITDFPNCHFCSYAPGSHPVNENGVYVVGAFARPVSVRRLQINHYVTRSRAEFDEKVARAAADGTRKDLNFYGIVERECGSIKDDGILRFVPSVQEALTRRAR